MFYEHSPIPCRADVSLSVVMFTSRHALYPSRSPLSVPHSPVVYIARSVFSWRCPTPPPRT